VVCKIDAKLVPQEFRMMSGNHEGIVDWQIFFSFAIFSAGTHPVARISLMYREGRVLTARGQADGSRYGWMLGHTN
jgi:hypothetical protein